jgi:DNA-binding SARP family transcriptional activator/tetratricopeptide (TPR) repeat protein
VIVRFQVLGEVRLTGADGAVVPVRHARVQSVLVVLLSDLNTVVPTDVLVDRVWGEDLPDDPKSTLYTYLSRARRVLSGGDARIVNRSGGYVLEASAEAVDLYRFQRLRADAARSTDDDVTADLLERALAEWRGEPFAGLETPYLTRLRTTLAREQLAARSEFFDVQLRRGFHREILADLAQMAREHPFDERLAARLVLALHRCDRRLEALDHYHHVRRLLADELGMDPGVELRQAHQAVLSADVPEPTERPVPRQLPADTAGFTGRDEYLRHLDKLVPDAAGPLAISAISGMAGIGKTTLAVHWAHRVADQFPDGQLYVDLRGYDPSGTVTDPAEAVRGFLDALGVPPRRVPAGVEAQVGLYRSLVADRRMLIVLDNARDAEQVRPLLPGAAGSHVVVTSRNQLTGLVVANSAHPLTLDLLSTTEAEQLLALRLGRARLAAEPDAVAEIVDLCACLPLAVALVAARAAARPSFPLAAIAAELRGSTDVDGVFSSSYQALTPAAARAFRLLGLHPGTDFGLSAAASVVGLPVADTRRLLRELCEAHVLAEPLPGRFGFHDLLRAYAARQASTVDSTATALTRLLDHYLHTAYLASQLFYPQRLTIPIGPPAAGVTVSDLADQVGAVAWFTNERPALTAAVYLAADHGFDQHCWQLAWAIANFQDRNGHWHEQADVLRVALAAATRLGDPRAQMHVLNNLAIITSHLGDFPLAEEQVKAAFDLARGMADPDAVGHTSLIHATVLLHQEKAREALAQVESARDLYVETGNEASLAEALNGLGWCHAQLGEYGQALEYCQQALAMHVKLGARISEADTMDSIGFIHHHLGDHSQAVAYYQRALAIDRELGDRNKQAEVLGHLGDAYAAAGEVEQARLAWQEKLAVLEAISSPIAEQLRARLADRPS